MKMIQITNSKVFTLTKKPNLILLISLATASWNETTTSWILSGKGFTKMDITYVLKSKFSKEFKLKENG